MTNLPKKMMMILILEWVLFKAIAIKLGLADNCAIEIVNLSMFFGKLQILKFIINKLLPLVFAFDCDKVS